MLLIYNLTTQDLNQFDVISTQVLDSNSISTMQSVNETKAALEFDVDGFRSHSEMENEWEGRLLLLKKTEQKYTYIICHYKILEYI